MKYYKQLLSLLLVCVLSFGLYLMPLTVSAATDNELFISTSFLDPEDGFILESNTVVGSASLVMGDEPFRVYEGNYFLLHKISRSDYGTLFKSGQEVSFSLNNLQLEMQSSYKTSVQYLRNSSIQVAFVYTDNSTEGVDVSVERITEYSNNYLYSISFDFVPSQNIKEIQIRESFNFSSYVGLNQVEDLEIYMWSGGLPTATYDVKDEKVTLLSRITDGINNIFDKITDGFDQMTSFFSDVGEWFRELPGKIWEKISEGLKGLFVPDEEYMVSYKDKWDELLSDRLGAVYQVVDIAHNSWDNVLAADAKNTIYIPEATIDVGAEFTFGGYEVQIVPNGFDFLIDLLKFIISIVCTFAFVNGLLKRYDEVMGVEQ